MMLQNDFFDRDTLDVAEDLLGKVLCAKYDGQWLCAQITETEAYLMAGNGSHASKGFTEKRKALFMAPGTIYMYYSRGKPSMNISTQGTGNAVLIKSARVYGDDEAMIATMQRLNPLPGPRTRPVKQLCAGQVLLCLSLGLTVPRWDQQTFDIDHFYVKDVGEVLQSVTRAPRRGIPKGRGEDLPYRFIAEFTDA